MVITSSTRNRVGGNTPRGFESHLLRQNKDHPSGWSLFFTPKVGFERRLLETCQWHVSTAVAARRPTTSKIFNGCLPQQMESHRPDLSARSIRRDGRLLAECMRCLRNISAKKIKKFLPADGIFRRTAVFHAAKSRRQSAEKCRFSPVLIIIFSV